MIDHDDRPSRTLTEDSDAGISHRYDWTETDPSTAIVEMAAVATDCDPRETDPLYDTIDPEALDAVLSPGQASPNDRSVSFEYCGHRVTAHASGHVAVQPAEADDAA